MKGLYLRIKWEIKNKYLRFKYRKVRKAWSDYYKENYTDKKSKPSY